MRRCKKKSAKAQKLLYKQYHGSLLGICMRYAKSKAEAEDILQMAMMKIFKNIGSYSGKGSFEGWMKRITVNMAVDNFRKSIKHYYHDSIDDTDEKALSADLIADNLEVKDILKTIQLLPDGYRVVFNLYAMEGYSHKEIAEKLGITESTSKTQLLKARRKLRKLLLSLNRIPEQTKKNENKLRFIRQFSNDTLIVVDTIMQK
ncbi:MAG: RNA polymerase subunit sigma-70 [Bacteroidetes bacterium]|nr:MAG: RNA polymerase subunit sigma-70 [Bacteroidota bacterium]